MLCDEHDCVFCTVIVCRLCGFVCFVCLFLCDKNNGLLRRRFAIKYVMETNRRVRLMRLGIIKQTHTYTHYTHSHHKPDKNRPKFVTAAPQVGLLAVAAAAPLAASTSPSPAVPANVAAATA